MTEIKRINPRCDDADGSDRGKRGKSGHPGMTGPTGPGGGSGDTFAASPPFVWQGDIEEFGESSGDLTLANYPTVTFIAMRAGSLIGLQVSLGAAMVSAGSLTFTITVNAVSSPTFVLTCTAGSNPSGGTVLGTQAYLAGDVIGVTFLADSAFEFQGEGEIAMSAWMESAQAA